MKKRRKSQKDRILQYLMTHKRGLTPDDAKEKFRSNRLAAKIAELREAGYNIVNIWDEYIDEDGEKVRFARYVLR